MLDSDRRLAAREDHRPLEHIAHLAHVAGPCRGQQPIEHVAAAFGGTAWQLRLEIGQDARDQVEPILARGSRSEEHTSELQSPYDLVCRLLLEKKKKTRLSVHIAII